MIKKWSYFLFVVSFILISAAQSLSQTVSKTTISTQTDQREKVVPVVPTDFVDENISLVQGTVVAVYDGDTISLQAANDKLYSIRLRGIDAPENNQSFGKESWESLTKLISGKEVTVVIHKKDIYDRYVGSVYYQGRDVSLLQIEAGWAWHFKKYADEQTAESRQKYADAEQKARTEKIGLWKSENPQPPWEHRNGGNDDKKDNSTTTGGTTDRKSDKKTRKKKKDREYIRGPRGGCYYINSNGNKTYVKDKSLCDN